MSTLASNSLLEVVTFAAVDAEKHVDDSLVQTSKPDFGYEAKFLFRL